MKIDFNSWDLGGKVIFVSAIVALLSLFMTWVDVGFIRASGFQQQGYLFLIPFIYPVYILLSNMPMNKVIGLICGGIAIVSTIAYIISKTVDIFGKTVNVAGMGMYVFVIASIGLTFGVYKYNALPTQEQNVE